MWKQIPGYEGLYEASDDGLIRSVDRDVWVRGKSNSVRCCRYKGRILKPYFRRDGKELPRPQVALSRQGVIKSFDVCELVARTYISSAEGTVNHIDGDPTNNRIENLERISLADNIRHAFAHNLIHTQKPVAMLADDGSIVAAYPGEAEACRRIGVLEGKIRRAIKSGWRCHGFYWAYIDPESATTIEIAPWKGKKVE